MDPRRFSMSLHASKIFQVVTTKMFHYLLSWGWEAKLPLVEWLLFWEVSNHYTFGCLWGTAPSCSPFINVEGGGGGGGCARLQDNTIPYFALVFIFHILCSEHALLPKSGWKLNEVKDTLPFLRSTYLHIQMILLWIKPFE